MKKVYHSPITNMVELKMQSALLSLSIKNEDANSAGMSREGNSDWEE